MSALLTGHGTRVIVDKDGVVHVIPSNQEHSLQEGEKELCYVREIDINFTPDSVVSARMEMFIVPTEITVFSKEIRFYADDPNDHFQEKRILRMEFEDGSVWSEGK